MNSFSLCMIVRDEALVLARCLASVEGVFDEIIIVDTGSTDDTRAIAALFTDKIFDFEWCFDFSAARNFSFSLATSDYIMWLDADDVVLPADKARLLHLKKTLSPDVDIVMLPYNTAFDGDRPTFSFYRERLIKRNRGLAFCGYVHEVIPLTGKVVCFDAAISHRKPKTDSGAGSSSLGAGNDSLGVESSYSKSGNGSAGAGNDSAGARNPSAGAGSSNLAAGNPSAGAGSSSLGGTRNLDIYLRQLACGRAFSPRDRFYYARELMFCGRYLEAAREFEGFLSDGGGSRINVEEANLNLSTCYKKLARPDDALSQLLKNLHFSAPTPRTSCEIAAHFVQKNDYPTAIFWYKCALALGKNEVSGAGLSGADVSGADVSGATGEGFEKNTVEASGTDASGADASVAGVSVLAGVGRIGAFVSLDHCGLIPHLMLCVCYYRLGDKRQAERHHRLASKISPLHPSVIYNNQFFS